jgi:hypothetical protein
MDNLEEVSENVTAYGIGSFCISSLGRPLEWFVHLHFKPLIPMLEDLCDEVFLTVKHDTTPMRMPTVASGDYDNVLRIFKTTLNKLPPHDGPLPSPPSANRDAGILMPPPPDLFHMNLGVGQHKSESILNWGSDSGYCEGISGSGSFQGRRLTASAGDAGGKKHCSSLLPKKTTVRPTTRLLINGVGRSSSKHSSDQHVIEDASTASLKRHRTGQD